VTSFTNIFIYAHSTEISLRRAIHTSIHGADVGISIEEPKMVTPLAD
jgi:hypothetical protein